MRINEFSEFGRGVVKETFIRADRLTGSVPEAWPVIEVFRHLSDVKPQHVQDSGSDFRPSVRGEGRNPGTKETPFDRAHPFGLEDARTGQPLFGCEVNLPRQTAYLGRKGHDGDLAERGQDVLPAEDQDRAPFVRRGKAEPANVTSLDHGISGSPSSSIGPCGPLSAHVCQSRAWTSAVRVASESSAGSIRTSTRFPSSGCTELSSVIVFP